MGGRGIAGEGEGWQGGRSAGEREGVKRDSHRQVKIGLRPLGMEEISLSGEGPGSAGPLYYSDMSPLKAVKLITRGELRDVTKLGEPKTLMEAEESGQRSSSLRAVREVDVVKGLNALCWTVVFGVCSFWPPAQD